MSGKGSGSQSARSLSQKNPPQAEQQPSTFEEGKAFFVRLQKNRLQEYENFQELS